MKIAKAHQNGGGIGEGVIAAWRNINKRISAWRETAA